MQFRNSKARFLVPDGTEENAALARVTHLGIGAHQDDLEFMAFQGILACHRSATDFFGGVICTDGAGSPRAGVYAALSDTEMQAVRAREQETAARLGGYGALLQLAYSSAEVKAPGGRALVEELKEILLMTRPRVVYTHNLADKHDTHVAVALAVVAAARELPPEARPATLYGGEVWRGLDWMRDEEKVVDDVSAHENLAAALNGAFDSQIAGGKRYDLATLGRRCANATFFQAHATDRARMAAFSMDLTPLLQPGLDPADYAAGFIRRFETEVRARVGRFSKG